MGRHSGQAVEPEHYVGSGIPAIDELCEWAVQENRWGDRLRLAPEVHSFFLSNKYQILSDRRCDQPDGEIEAPSENTLHTEEEAHV